MPANKPEPGREIAGSPAALSWPALALALLTGVGAVAALAWVSVTYVI
jgi:hypothetical protein